MWISTATVEQFGSFLIKLNIHLLDASAVALMDIYPREMNSYVHEKTYRQMFIAALPVVGKHWKQLRCTSVDKRSNKSWHIHTVEYYLAVKNNEVLIPAITRISLQGIMLSGKKNNPKRFYTIKFHSYNILEWWKYKDRD